MFKKILLSLLGLSFGIIFSIFILKYFGKLSPNVNKLLTPLGLQKTEVVGFLPYWLISEENNNYLTYLNSISYFGLTVTADGSIEKFTKPTETEPGWLSLKSGKINAIMDIFKQKNFKRSLVVFSGNQENISQLIEDPVKHAENLMNEVSPVISQYGFTDLNLDIESVSIASDIARQNFTVFIKIVHEQLQKNNPGITLSIDVSPIVLFKPYLVNVSAISSFVDTVIFMNYDFHYQGSSVTGAVSPVNGAGISAEFDTEISVKEALKILPPEKIIMGVPLYGYEWETLSDYPHASVIPGSGITASNKRVEEFLSKCASCSAKFDPVSKESYFIYLDQETNTYHQFFYPDKQATEEKVNLVKKYRLGGIALWALGYEGSSILEPLKNLQ